MLCQNILAQGLDWGKLDRHKGSVLVEFVSSNPTGPLHVGHGRALSWDGALTCWKILATK